MEIVITLGVLCLSALLQLLVWGGQALEDDALVISSGPSSLNVSVNSQAMFSCQAMPSSGDLNLFFVKWYLNGTPVELQETLTTTSVYAVISATTHIHTITFQVDDTNAKILNNSNITCQGFYANELEPLFVLTSFSEPALLLIQGILSSPEILNASVENGSISLHWMQPFTLMGVAIHYYRLNVTVKVSLDRYNVLTSNSIHHTNEEQSSFPEPHEGICNVYNICVQAVSAAGMGDPACIINFNETKKPRILAEKEVDVEVAFMQDASVISTYTFAQDHCLQRRAEKFTLIAAFLNNRPSLHFHSTITPDSDQPISLKMTIPQSQSTEIGNVTIVLTNNAGSTEIDPITAELSCVHNVSFVDDKSIVCLFVSGCVANGSKVVIECDQLSTVEQEPYILNLMREKDSLVSEGGLLPCDSIATCTANSVVVYAVHNDSHSDVPDVAHNIPIHVCTTSTMYGTSGMMDPQPTSPTQSSIPESSYLYLAIAVGLTSFVLIVSCICMLYVAAVTIYRYVHLRKSKHSSPTW